MGNQAAAMKKFPYEIGEPYADTFLWRLHHGKKKATQEHVTIFSCEITNIARDKLDMVRSSFKRMKTIRHPNFIKYLDGVELQTHIYVVTEYVQPLNHVLKNMFVEIGSNEAISWGLFQVIQGIEFLHSRRMYHCGISAQSIFVDVSGDWRIGELGFLSEIGGGVGGANNNNNNNSNNGFDPNYSLPPQENHSNGTNDLALRTFAQFLQQKYRTPEMMSQRWDLIEKYPDKVDSWGVGCLIFEIFEGDMSNMHDLKRVTSKVPKTILYSYNQLLNEDPSIRASLSDFLQLPFFNNSMIKTQQFLDNLNLKDPVAIESFLTQLPESLASFPKKNCKYRILPHLINAIKFGSGGSKAIIPIFMIGEMMTVEEFKEDFIPKILDLFESNDRTVRVNLLKNLKTIMPHLSVDNVEQKIYPNVAKGFRDSSPIVREMTVKSMIDIVPKLTEHTVSENVIRFLWALQGDKEPAIRTNTIIALGKLARNLSEKTRKRILLAAFARSLKDPFVHSRTACLKALLSTKDLHTPAELAQKAIPAIAPLTVDVNKGVRDLAFQCMNTFLEVLQQCSEAPNFAERVGFEVPPLPENHDGTNNTATPAHTTSSSNMAHGQSSNMAEDGTYLGWAVSSVSSLKSKIVGEKGHIGTDIKRPTTTSTPVATGSSTGANNSNLRPIMIPTTSTSSTVPTQTQPTTKPVVKPVLNKPVGLKLAHDTPKNDIFADTAMKQGSAPAANDDPFANDDMFADMSFSNMGSGTTKKGKTVLASTSSNNSSFSPSGTSGRSQQSLATSNNSSTSGNNNNGVMSFTSNPVKPSSNQQAGRTQNNNNMMNSENDFNFGDWDDMIATTNSSPQVPSADDFFNSVMDDDDIFGLGSQKAQKAKPQKLPQPRASSSRSDNALKFDRPKSDVPSRSKTSGTKTTPVSSARQSQVRQKDVDQWEDWSWDDMK